MRKLFGILIILFYFVFFGVAFARQQQLLQDYLFKDSSLVAYYPLNGVQDFGPSGFTLHNTSSVAFDTGIFFNGADFGTSNSTKELGVTNNLGINGGRDRKSVV